MSVSTLEEFSGKAKAFLDSSAVPKAQPSGFSWGEGDDGTSSFLTQDPATEAHEVAEARAWQTKRYEAGFGWITGAPEYGGLGLGGEYAHLYRQIEAGYDVPSSRPLARGLDIVGPAIVRHGDQELRRRYLSAIYRGESIVCQLYSEPGAGSDLAGLETRAVRSGGEWVVHGQKVWTTGAHYSDIGHLICRTSPEKPKHQGLTMFMVDMRAPGVEVRPLRDITGATHFNEVFLDGVHIPDEDRLGAVDDGWSVMRTTLMFERAHVGTFVEDSSRVFTPERLAFTMRHLELDGDEGLRDQLAQVLVRWEVARFAAEHSRLLPIAPGPERALAKLTYSENRELLAELGCRALAHRVTADRGEWGVFVWALSALDAPRMRIAGGTDEILRNLVGERVLGLPKDHGFDKSTPFKDLPRSPGRPS